MAPVNATVLSVKGAKISPRAITVARSVTKQAARTVFPYPVVLIPSSSITAYTTATDVVDMAIPASQLASGVQPRHHQASAAQRKNGRKKLISPIISACFHCFLKTVGSSSAPARKVSSIAPAPDKNCTQLASPASMLAPNRAPIMSCAIVPTTISESAVAIRRYIDRIVAINARPSHSAAWNQISVI